MLSGQNSNHRLETTINKPLDGKKVGNFVCKGWRAVRLGRCCVACAHRVHTKVVVRQPASRKGYSKVLEGASKKVLRRCLAVGFRRKKGSENHDGHVRPRQVTEICNFGALSPLQALHWIFCFFSSIYSTN